MIDGRTPNHTHEAIDVLLSRVLGSRTVPEELKRRHLAAARRSFTILEPSRRPSISLRLGASLAVALLLVAITGLVMTGIIGRDDPGTANSALAAAEHHFSAPPAGAGRHIEARFVVASPSVENTTDAVAEVWSRTQADGQVQTEVLARDANGNLLGRTVETANGQWLDLGGVLYEFGDPTPIKPITSLLLQIRYFIEFDKVITRVENEFSDDAVVSVRSREGRRIITIQFLEPRSPEGQAAIAEQFGTPPGRLGYEIAISSDSKNPVSWEWFITDTAENRHTILEVEFERWEELTFDEIDDSHFDTDSSKT